MSSNVPGDQFRRLILQMPRHEAQQRIDSQIQKGRDLLDRRVASYSGLDKLMADQTMWTEYNTELLRAITTDDILSSEYRNIKEVDSSTNTRYKRDLESLRAVLQKRIRFLQSVYQRLELLPEAPGTNSIGQHSVEQPASVAGEIGHRVFVVHGHDEEAKHSVARCIEKLGLEAIILQEQPDQGRTIIEKFETYADVDFAVVLLTPDDVGAAKRVQDSLRPRARQNVILELGFFIGKLGRKHVCALHKGDVELPSDFSGILWTPMDDSGAWRFKLATEMKQAGLAVDLNRLSG
jgi:predicted nucleotide-binding protein